MAEYIPSPRDWVREQVELYEHSGGTQGTTLRDTGLPVIIVTNTGNKTGAIRKTPLMRVKDGNRYVLIGSQGGAPKHPVWVYNLRANPAVEIRDQTAVQAMRVREVNNDAERARLWELAVAAFPPYADYQAKTTRKIPVFVAEPEPGDQPQARHGLVNQTRLALLQKMPVFGGIREDILQFILDISPTVTAPKGKFFFHQQDAANSMFVLEQGKVAILKTWKGQEYLLRGMQTGDCFGEMAVIDLLPRSASVLATEDSVAIEISSATLYQVYKKDLEQLAMIYMNMGREISRRLRETDEHMFQAKIEAVVIGDEYVFKSV